MTTSSIKRVVALDEHSVTIPNFDSLGIRDEEPYIVAYGEITKLQFDTPYNNSITKYLEEPSQENGRR